LHNYQGDKTKDDEMGGAYLTHSGERKLVLCFDVQTPWGGGKKKLC